MSHSGERKRWLARTGLATLASSASVVAFTFVQGIALARGLPTSSRGEYAAIIALVMTSAWIAEIGCSEAVSFHQSRAPGDAGALLSGWLLILACTSCVSIAVIELVVPLLFADLGDHAILCARLYAAFLPVAVANELTSGVLLGDQDFAFVNIVNVAEAFLCAAALIGLWASDSLSLASGLVAAALPTLGATVAFAIRAFRRHGLARPRKALTKETAWYGARVHVSNVGAMLNLRAPLLILPLVVSASDVGLFAVAAGVTSAGAMLVSVLTGFVLPVAARDRQEGELVTRGAVRASLLIAAACGAVLLVAANVLVPAIYGDRFQDSVPLVRWLIPGSVFFPASLILLAAVKAHGFPLRPAIPQAVGLACLAVGLLVLVPASGLVAGAITVSAAYAAVFVAATVLERKSRRAPVEGSLA